MVEQNAWLCNAAPLLLHLTLVPSPEGEGGRAAFYFSNSVLTNHQHNLVQHSITDDVVETKCLDLQYSTAPSPLEKEMEDGATLKLLLLSIFLS